MTDFRTESAGQIVGISHHDGQIRSIALRGNEQIDLCIVSSGGSEAKVLLIGVQYFVLSNLREGNIIDRMYLWDLSNTPSIIMKRMLRAMNILSADVLFEKFSSGVQVFHLECSYGAELFAVVDRLQIDVG